MTGLLVIFSDPASAYILRTLDGIDSQNISEHFVKVSSVSLKQSGRVRWGGGVNIDCMNEVGKIK